jgi:NTP pyrophosphatase (non-canonical NTP hydrolase)
LLLLSAAEFDATGHPETAALLRAASDALGAAVPLEATHREPETLAEFAKHGLRVPLLEDPQPQRGLDALADVLGMHVDRLWPEQTLAGSGLALSEECGEVNRAILKRQHGTKKTHEEWTANLRLEVGQVVGVCMDIARREGFSLSAVVGEVVAALCVREREERRDG